MLHNRNANHRRPAAVGVSLLVSVLAVLSVRFLYYGNQTFFLTCTAVERLFKRPEPAIPR